jgi:hypothetical protein
MGYDNDLNALQAALTAAEKDAVDAETQAAFRFEALLKAATERAEAAERVIAGQRYELAWLRQHCGLTASEREQELTAELEALRAKATLADAMEEWLENFGAAFEWVEQGDAPTLIDDDGIKSWRDDYAKAHALTTPAPAETA